MPRTPLTEAAMALLAQPNPAVIAVVRPDGQPVSVATWYLVEEDGRILVNMDSGRSATTTCATTPGELDRTEGRCLVHPHLGPGPHYAVARRSYSNRLRPRVSALIEIEYWHGWGAVKPSDG